jgi:hypothetical protein
MVMAGVTPLASARGFRRVNRVPPRQKPPAEAGGMTLPITHDAVGHMPGIETPGK